jgi:hypothetical protein
MEGAPLQALREHRPAAAVEPQCLEQPTVAAYGDVQRTIERVRVEWLGAADQRVERAAHVNGGRGHGHPRAGAESQHGATTVSTRCKVAVSKSASYSTMTVPTRRRKPVAGRGRQPGRGRGDHLDDPERGQRRGRTRHVDPPRLERSAGRRRSVGPTRPARARCPRLRRGAGPPHLGSRPCDGTWWHPGWKITRRRIGRPPGLADRSRYSYAGSAVGRWARRFRSALLGPSQPRAISGTPASSEANHRNL